MKKYRVYRAETDETIIIIEAKSIYEASAKVGRIFGDDNDTIDFEEV